MVIASLWLLCSVVSYVFIRLGSHVEWVVAAEDRSESSLKFADKHYTWRRHHRIKFLVLVTLGGPLAAFISTVVLTMILLTDWQKLCGSKWLNEKVGW